MTKNQFKAQCAELESEGYTILEFEPENKYASYMLNGDVRVIGRKK